MHALITILTAMEMLKGPSKSSGADHSQNDLPHTWVLQEQMTGSAKSARLGP